MKKLRDTLGKLYEVLKEEKGEFETLDEVIDIIEDLMRKNELKTLDELHTYYDKLNYQEQSNQTARDKAEYLLEKDNNYE